eukprot:COSAG01_NODE_12128_length_1797_cov_1.280919_3_plen_30_part_01
MTDFATLIAQFRYMVASPVDAYDTGEAEEG